MLCWYWVCASSDKVDQERLQVCPRLYCTPDYWCWWCHINTWLTPVHHYYSSHFPFPSLSFTRRHMCTWACTHTEACVVCGLVCGDVILQTFSAACLSRLWRWKHWKLVRHCKSCPQAERLDSKITCMTIHSCPDCSSYSVLFTTVAIYSHKTNSWWTLADCRVVY